MGLKRLSGKMILPFTGRLTFNSPMPADKASFALTKTHLAPESFKLLGAAHIAVLAYHAVQSQAEGLTTRWLYHDGLAH